MFITTTNISSEIEGLIKKANVYIILVSPYIDINPRLRKIIEHKLKSSYVSITIVCREHLKRDQGNWFSKNRIQIIYKDDLHAKCYLNENKAIITSMNLYHFSQVNNIEFGVVFTMSKNLIEFKKIIDEVKILFEDKYVVYQYDPEKIVNIEELIDEYEVVDYKIVTKENRASYLCLLTASGEELFIGIGSHISFNNKGQKRVDELIDNYEIYKVRGYDTALQFV